MNPGPRVEGLPPERDDGLDDHAERSLRLRWVEGHRRDRVRRAAQWCAACQSQAANHATARRAVRRARHPRVTSSCRTRARRPRRDDGSTGEAQYGLTEHHRRGRSGVLVCAAQPKLGLLPVTIVVDPRTMTIMKVEQGYMAAYPLQPDAEAVRSRRRTADERVSVVALMCRRVQRFRARRTPPPTRTSKTARP